MTRQAALPLHHRGTLSQYFNLLNIIKGLQTFHHAPPLLQCTYMYIEPDKTYNTTMYVRPAKTQVSLCIDPLYKASFWHTVRSAKGLIRMRCCIHTVYLALDSPAIKGKYDQRMLLSECAVAQTDLSLRLSHKMFCYTQ